MLSKKWEILFLLLRLADSNPGAAQNHSTEGKRPVEQKPNGRQDGNFGSSSEADEQTYRDAFAPSGLPNLQPESARSKSVAVGASAAERRAKSKIPDRSLANEDDEEPTAKVSLAGPSEDALLRDIPFTLQGLSTKNLKFTSQNTLELPSSLSLPVTSLLNTLAEPSLLYRSLSEFVESKDEGLIGQSLRSAVSNELRSYLGLISSLETQIRQALATKNESGAQQSDGRVGVTLKRCVLWTREATMGLRIMSIMSEEAGAKKGGQLVSMIHGFSTSHGDPFVGAFAERMLAHVTRPFYDMLRQWIYDGELADPYNEFFVIEQASSVLVEDPRRAPATSVWEEKYRLDESMIPSIITEDFARKVFLIGKSLNFIRYGCGDSAWVEAYSKEASRELKYGDTATLETSIDQAYKTTMARLTSLMDSKFQLFEHLNALKRYLLLGQGDFIALLMESLATNLDRPAGSQYRHTLTAQLEHAIRGSNAQFDPPDILRRLDARLTEMEKGDTGWDVFTLEYKVDAPVDVIITPWANRQYLKIFNLLWRIKRVEFALSSTWRRCMTGARGVLASVDAKLKKDWKSARCTIAEMIHFVNQLQYYFLFEVIEASWSSLNTTMSKPDATLDDLISAHTKYLKSITLKGLLGSTRTTSSGHKEDVFTVQLHEILKTMLAYKEAVDGLYSFSVAEFTRKQFEGRPGQSKYGITTTTEKDDDDSPSPYPTTTKKLAANGPASQDTDSPFPLTSHPLTHLASDEETLLPALRQRLSTLSADFKTRINNLLGDLAVQPDVDMKFLAVVMNFNDVYQPRKRRRHHPGVTGTERKTPAAQMQGSGGGGGDATVRKEGGEGGSTTSKGKEKERGK